MIEAERFEAVGPAEIEAYLSTHAWVAAERLDVGTLWLSPADNSLDLLVPRTVQIRDYARRIRDVIVVLSEYESRPAAEILSDLSLATADVIRFRVFRAFSDNTLTLDEGLDLFERARDAIRSAAWAVTERKPVFTSRPPNRVAEFMDSVRLGQTEAGSYVVPIIAPLGTTEALPGELTREDEPFGRFVSVTFARSLGAMTNSLESVRASGDMSPFLDAVEEGVSANLCEAVGDLAAAAKPDPKKPQTEPGVGIEFSWSLARPLRSSVKSGFRVTERDGALLHDASEFLRRLVPRQTAVITGRVVRLERGDEEADGTIGIKGDVDGVERTVAVRLRPLDYARAIHAHEAGADVTCSGVLERRGNYSYLTEPIEFTTPPALF